MSKGKNREETTESRQKTERIDDTTITYYKRVGTTIEEGFDSEEDKALFLKNVFVELNKDLARVSKCATLSKIIESIIVEAEGNEIFKLLIEIIPHWTDLCTNRYASHVVQTLLSVLPKSFSIESSNIEQKEDKSGDEEEPCEHTPKEVFLTICTVVKGDVSGYITNIYASHILRTIMELLAGYRVEDQIVRSRSSRNFHEKGSKNLPEIKPIPDFKNKFQKLAKAVFKSEKIKECLTDRIANPVIQTLLILLKKTESGKFEKHCRKLMKICCLNDEIQPDKLPPIIMDEIGSYLVECLITVASPTVLESIYTKLFKARVELYAMHRIANHVLQKFLIAIVDKSQFEEMFEEISPHLENLFAANHIGVVVKIAEACLRIGGKQEKLIKALTKVLHCHEPADRKTDLLRLLASVSTYEVYHGIEEDSEKEKSEEKVKAQSLENVVYMGSILLQTMMKFGNAKILVDGMLKLSHTEMRNLICHSCGGHVVDVFLQSPTIGFKSREAFIQKLKGLFAEISCDKAGSRVMETIWSVSKNYEKTAIMEELAKSEGKMLSNCFGRIIYFKFGVSSFKRNPKMWSDPQGKNVKKRKMFEDIIGGKGDDGDGNKGKPYNDKKPRLQKNFERRDSRKPFPNTGKKRKL